MKPAVLISAAIIVAAIIVAAAIPRPHPAKKPVDPVNAFANLTAPCAQHPNAPNCKKP